MTCRRVPFECRDACGRRALAAVTALALLLAACVSDRAPLAPAEERVDCVLPLHAVRRGDHIVLIRSFAFAPDTVRVARGTTVTWVNCEPAATEAHTTTARQGAWGSPLLRSGEYFSHTFNAPGRYSYACAPHAVMQAEVVVE